MAVDLCRLTTRTMNVNAGHERTSKARIIHQIQLIRGITDFWNWLQNGAGQKTVDILIRIALILFFSAVGWTVLASLIENRLASDIHGRPLPSARTRTLLTLFRNALAVIISTITIMIVLSEIGVNIAPLLAGAGALGLAISFGVMTLTY